MIMPVFFGEVKNSFWVQKNKTKQRQRQQQQQQQQKQAGFSER